MLLSLTGGYIEYGRGKGGSADTARWQVTQCDPIWHAGSRSGAVLIAHTAICFFTFFTFTYIHLECMQQ